LGYCRERKNEAQFGDQYGRRRRGRGSAAELTFTNDPLAASVLTEARHAAAAGLLRPLPGSLAGMYDLGPLNTFLRAAGERPVPGS